MITRVFATSSGSTITCQRPRRPQLREVVWRHVHAHEHRRRQRSARARRSKALSAPERVRAQSRPPQDRHPQQPSRRRHAEVAGDGVDDRPVHAEPGELCRAPRPSARVAGSREPQRRDVRSQGQRDRNHSRLERPIDREAQPCGIPRPPRCEPRPFSRLEVRPMRQTCPREDHGGATSSAPSARALQSSKQEASVCEREEPTDRDGRRGQRR